MRLLITGSTGMAGATASLARDRGHQVITVGLDSTADVVADLREEDAVRQAFAIATTQLGGVDALFNAAGASGRQWGDGPLHQCSAEGFDETLRVNLRSLFLMSREAIRYWLDRNQPGTILQMGSILASHPEPQHFAAHAYAAAKGAIEALAINSAGYYAPYGIRINVLTPGLVRTPMSTRAQSNPDIQQFVREKQPLTQGMLEPDAVAKVALFLLSEESHPMTGAIVPADGGWAVR